MRPERLWVSPNFKRKIKQEAAEKGLSVLELTEEMSFDDLMRMKNAKKGVRFRL